MSIASRQAASASARCGAETAITTEIAARASDAIRDGRPRSGSLVDVMGRLQEMGVQVDVQGVQARKEMHARGCEGEPEQQREERRAAPPPGCNGRL